MIEVSVVLDPDKAVLKEVDVRGHGDKGETGYSIVCAAVSTLARTAARSIEPVRDYEVVGEAGAPGDLHFEVYETNAGRVEDYEANAGPGAEKPTHTQRKEIRSDAAAWLRGVTDFFVTGVRDIESEYPSECRVKIKSEGEAYGS